MKIGIPAALFGAYHFGYWKQFFTRLGWETVSSGQSTKAMADCGGKMIPPEFCAPVKLFFGHVMALAPQDADLILIPRMHASGNRNFFCPKLIGLPDMVRYVAGIPEDRLYSPEIACNGLDLRIIKPPPRPIPAPVCKLTELATRRYWRQVLNQCRSKRLTLPEAFETISKISHPASQPDGIKSLRIGLIGYAYNLYDPFLSKGIINLLTRQGVAVHTWEMLNPPQIEARLQGLTRPLFWNFGRILLGAGLHFLKAPEIDGVIYVSSFGCGPDSVSMKLLSLEAADCGKPLLQLNLDEHSEDGHLRTRLEAFTDMLAERKEGRSA